MRFHSQHQTPPGEGYDPTGRCYDHDRIYEQTFIRHQYIAGDASYLYFTRRSGEPPFLLVMTKPGTGIEYFDNSSVFIHSAMAHEEDGTRSRAGNTSLVLSPAGKEGSKVEYGYRLEWVDSYEEMREVIYKNGLFDIRKEAETKTGPSGIGRENYTWYLQKVHLVPLTWEDELMILKNELARAWSSLKLEEHRNRNLPELKAISSPEEFRDRAERSLQSLMEFLEQDEFVTVKEYFEPALREHLGSFIPEENVTFSGYWDIMTRDHCILTVITG